MNRTLIIISAFALALLLNTRGFAQEVGEHAIPIVTRTP